MDAFFFGPPDCQLLGVYHPPEPGRERYEGVVLCYPFGQEYMRAHRAYRQLATTLAKKGFHVLRFDYRGTGDSAAELEEVTAHQWLEDLDYAVQELKDLTGVHRISLVGLRIGALLAGLFATDRRDLSSLVLWDPMTRGSDYIEELRENIRQSGLKKRESKFVDGDGHLHFNGFCMSRQFQQSLSEMELFGRQPSCRRVLLLGSHPNRSFDDLATAWRSAGEVDYRHVSAEHDWNYVDHVGGILIPQAILAEIGAWL